MSGLWRIIGAAVLLDSAILGVGAIYYGMHMLPPDPQSGLVFVLVSFHQFLALILLGAAFMIARAWRKRRSGAE